MNSIFLFSFDEEYEVRVLQTRGDSVISVISIRKEAAVHWTPIASFDHLIDEGVARMTVAAHLTGKILKPS